MSTPLVLSLLGVAFFVALIALATVAGAFLAWRAAGQRDNQLAHLAQVVAAQQQDLAALQALPATWESTLEQLGDLAETVEKKRRRAAAAASRERAEPEVEVPQGRAAEIAQARAKIRGLRG